MPTPEETMFAQVQEAAAQGDKARARDLLTRLLRVNPNNAEYWLWMSSVVESIKERTFCLKEALRLDPQNRVARQGLILIGVLPLDESQVIPRRLLRRNWEKEILGTAIEKPPALISRRVWILGSILLVLVAATVVLLLSLRGPELVVVRPTPPQLEPTSTFMPTPSPVVRSPTPTFSGPTPLGIALQVTYTPTPFYIATEHPRTESYRSALSQFKLGAWDQAIEYFGQVLTPEPGAADVYFYIGEAQRFKKEYARASQAYRQAQQVNPAFAPGYYGEALILMMQAESLPQAEALLQKALELDPRFTDAWIKLAEAAVLAGRPGDALAALDQARAVQLWESPAWYRVRAQANLLLDQPGEALQDALTASQLDQADLDSYRVLAQAYQANGDLAASLEPLTIYLLYKPEDSQALLWLLQAYRAAGDNEKAVQLISQLLQQDRRQYALYLERGWIYLELGENQKALDDFLVYFAYDERSLEVHLGLGRAYLGMEQYANAWQQFYDGLPYAETDAEKAQVYYWKSLALEGQENLDGAANDWYALLALPADAIPDEWEEYARLRLAELKRRVPTPVRLQSPTPSPSPTATRVLGVNTRTPTPTATRTPTLAASPTPTRTVTRTP